MKHSFMNRFTKLSTAFLGLCIVTSAFATQPVRVASKIDTEGMLLGNMIVDVLKANNIPVKNDVALGATSIVRQALVNGEIDIYPEYTGNGAFFTDTASSPVWKNHEQGYATIAKYDREKNHLIWLTPAPANNTWAIAVTKKLAEKAHLKTMSDFAQYVRDGGKVKLAASAEFIESPVALPSFEKVYDFKLNQNQELVLSGGNTSATISAAASGINGTNAAMVYGTDGAISAANLLVLDDPKGAQGVYSPAPVIREAVLKEYPQIKTLLKPVFTSLTREKLQSLNEKIQVNGESAKDVAKQYLISNGFIK